MPTASPTSFADLPPEVLGHIISQLDSAKTLAALSHTCKLLNTFVDEDGYRLFVKSNFPTLRTPPQWKAAAHALTTLTKCWDRRAFICFPTRFTNNGDYLYLPKLGPEQRRHQLQPRNTKQSMGYQPVLDSRLEWRGGSWSSQTELLVIGAGAELKVRTRRMGPEVHQEFRGMNNRSDRNRHFNHLVHRVKDVVWWPPEYLHGRDDITAVNILRSIDGHSERASYQVLVGRASGSLHKVYITPANGTVRTSALDTSEQGVRSAHATPLDSSSDKQLAAACLSDGRLALYDVGSEADEIPPLDGISVGESKSTSRPWVNKWLNSSQVAVGRGPSKSPLVVYQIRPTSITSEPLWKCTTPSKEESVYSIMPISPNSPAGSAENGQFLSGWFAGQISLHDLRTNLPAVQEFHDPVEPSAVYSLLPFGGERFVAGGARHSMIKVFDLRMPGEARYIPGRADAEESKESTTTRPLSGGRFTDIPEKLVKAPPNFNVYLSSSISIGPFCPNRPDYNPNRIQPHRYTYLDSPVYSLTAPSSFSPVFYAGLENEVLEIALVSGIDRTPDSMFTSNVRNVGGMPTPKSPPRALPPAHMPFSHPNWAAYPTSLVAVEHLNDKKGGMDIGTPKQQSGVALPYDYWIWGQWLDEMRGGRWDYRWKGYLSGGTQGGSSGRRLR